MSANVGDAGERIEALIRERKKIDTERLADADAPLEEVTTEPVGRLFAPTYAVSSSGTPRRRPGTVPVTAPL